MIAACGDENVIGAAFYLMEPVEGFTPREEMPALHANDPAIRHAMGLEMVDAIAALPRSTTRRAVSPVWASSTAFSSARSVAGARSSRAMPNIRAGRDLRAFPASTKSALAERHIVRKTFVPGIIHGDFHFGNVLFDRNSPKMTAMVDWELTTLGDPMVDLGWLLSAWPEDGAEIGPGQTVERLSDARRDRCALRGQDRPRCQPRRLVRGSRLLQARRDPRRHLCPRLRWTRAEGDGRLPARLDGQSVHACADEDLLKRVASRKLILRQAQDEDL